MIRITLKGIDGAAIGTYELEHTRLSNREAKVVERYTGIRASVFQAGLAAVRDIDPETGDLAVDDKGELKGGPVVKASEYSDADHQDVFVWLALRRNGQPDIRIEDIPEYDSLASIFEYIADPTDGPVPDAPADPQAPAADVLPPANPDGV